MEYEKSNYKCYYNIVRDSFILFFYKKFENDALNNAVINTNINNETEDNVMKLNINGSEFEVVLENNETAKALVDMLPMDVEMSELNGNEKYYYLDENLPTNSENIGHINAGDIMLYGEYCLVLFYESFNTSYSYTKIGYIENTNNLKSVVGRSSVNVRWEK